ncbi:MAG: GH3 auxin-responsive promoter family protein [bacterium]
MKIDPLSFFFRDFVLIRTAQLELNDTQASILQRYVLFRLVSRARETKFGKTHNFKKIQTIKSFQKNVPIAHYDDLKEDIREMMLGGKDILWPGETHYFTKSSATTADSKYIPMSEGALLRCHYKGGKDLITFYLRSNPDTHLFSGKVLSLCGTFYPFPENENIEVGDVSAILTKNLPNFAQWFRFPGPELALKTGWEQKIEEISDLATKENITAIVGVPMWTLAFIKKVLEKSGKESIFEVWPNLEVFMHGGISFKPYRAIFDELFKDKGIKYIESYNASEGYFAIQDDIKRPGEMRLMFDYGVFYEFIPVELYERGIYEAITIRKVKLNVNYVIVITTNAGLWRYVIGDTIMFTSFSPYRLKITGRTKQYLNVYDEEITMENVEHAISFASLGTNAQVTNFTMCATEPDKEGRGSHEWVIEFSKSPGDLEKFKNLVDEALIKENGDYASRRVNDVVLKKPIIHSIPEGTFYEWMKSKNKLNAQGKVPRISNSREHVESILKLVK